MSERQWSPYQLGFYNWLETDTGNCVLMAVAGSGKTTTGVEGVKRIPRGYNHIFLAFNKAIATELSARGVNARTFHSITYSPVTRARNTRNVEPNKLWQIVDERLGDDDAKLYGEFMVRLVGLARQQGFGCLTDGTPEEWAELADYHDLDLGTEAASREHALQLSQELLKWSNDHELVDFDDLLYLAVRDGIALPKFDYIFVDEAQDTNAIQRALLRKIMKPTSRLIAVGDPAQAIYGFRGADATASNYL